MEITFKVSQARKRVNGKPYPVLPTLFEVEEMKMKNILNLEDFTSNLLNFHKHLKKVFNSDKYPNILTACDEVLAKIDFCVDFENGDFCKNHKISSPLTLFISYNQKSVEDVAIHIFLTLINKWQEFYEMSIKNKEEKC